MTELSQTENVQNVEENIIFIRLNVSNKNMLEIYMQYLLAFGK